MSDLGDLFRRNITLVERMRNRAGSFPEGISRWERRALSEVLVSDLWQLWNTFVRAMCLRSCEGCTTRSGLTVPARAGDNSWQRISYEASKYAQASKNKTRPKVQATGRHRARRQDPTWGDLATIVDVVNGLSPANARNLSTAFGATAQGLKDLQRVRNACFHKNRETWNDVKALEKVSFASSDTRDPSDLAWKSYLGESTPAIFKWIEAVLAVCKAATK